MSPLRKIFTLFSFILVATSLLVAENEKMRFPQNKNYGLKPTGSNSALAAVVKNQYETNYLRFWRPEGYFYSPDTDGNGATTSEAHGFGMMLTAIMGDKYKFDKLVTYYNSKKTHGNLMDWLDGWGGGAALDGDLDIAYGFLLADKQWPGNGYGSKANLILDDIWSQETNGAYSTPRCGTGYSNTSLTRPSDWMGSHFRAYDVVDDGSNWTSIATACYDAYNAFLSNNPEASGTGLISDFVDGGYPAFGNEDWVTDLIYNYNACRVPMRLAMDYVTTSSGKSAAAPFITKITNWLSSNCSDNAANIGGGYELDGTKYSEDAGLEYVAPFGAALVATNNKTFMNSIWGNLQESWMHNYEDTGDSATAYGEAIATLSMLIMTGNFWKPTDNDTYVEDYIDTNGVILDDFGNGFGDDNAQAHLGAARGVVWGDDNKGGTPAGDSTYHYGGCYWYGYAAPDATIKDANGDVIFDHNENPDAPSDNIVSNNKLNITFELKGGNSNSYDYAGIGVSLGADIQASGDTAISTDAKADLSNMTAVTIRYKSNGSLRMSFETEKVKELAESSPSDAWVSDFGWFLPASPDEFTQAEFKIEDIKPETGGSILDTLITADAGTWGWKASGNANKVSAFGITASEDADKGANINLEIEEIILVKMKYTDFGFTYREPTPIPITSISKSMTKNNWTPFTNGNIAGIKFNSLTSANVEATLYNATGKKITTTSKNVKQGLSKVMFENVNISNGRYFVKVKANGRVSTSAFNFVK